MKVSTTHLSSKDEVCDEQACVFVADHGKSDSDTLSSEAQGDVKEDQRPSGLELELGGCKAVQQGDEEDGCSQSVEGRRQAEGERRKDSQRLQSESWVSLAFDGY